jgi:GTP-binding protein Era
MSENITQHRAGYVAIIGRPNVGKSTLVNALLEQKIAAVSAKPQTTRRRQLGILTTPSEQVIFVDTPGLHVPQHKLGDFMNQEAVEALLDADLILWLLDASEPFVREDHLIAERLNTLKKHPPVLMALTKADLASQETLAQRQKQAVDLYPGEDVLFLSAVNKTGLDELLARIVNHMPVGEPFFSEDTVTDYYERDIAADLIRQSVLQFIRDEVPHCVAIRIDTYEERGEEGAYIEGTIFVERDSQKGIIIGKGGEMIKKIGTQARKEIEEMSGRKVFLSLKTKVNKNWRNDPEALKLMGYNPSTTEE